jgi:UDP-galactopyranose mutase
VKAPQEDAKEATKVYDAILIGAGMAGVFLTAEAVNQDYKNILVLEKKNW